MSKKKTIIKSAKTGRIVSKEYATGDENETFVQTITIGQKKYDEACELLEALKAKKCNHQLTAEESAYQLLLEWLLKNGEKPEISSYNNY